MDALGQDRRILRDGLRRHAENVLQADAGVGHAGGAVRTRPMLIEARGNDRRDLVVAVLQLQPAHRLGDFAQRSVIVERLAGHLVANQPDAFLDPDPLARVVTVDFRNDAGDPSVLEQHLMDFGAPIGIDVPFRCDVVAASNELLFRLVAVQPHQRRVGADHPAAERRAEHAFADVLVEVAKAELRRPRREHGALALKRECRKSDRGQNRYCEEYFEQTLPVRRICVGAGKIDEKNQRERSGERSRGPRQRSRA